MYFPYFSQISLKENVDTTIAQNQMRDIYVDKMNAIRQFSGFQFLNIVGPVQTSTGLFLSQDNLIHYSGLVLPRVAFVDMARYESLIKKVLPWKYDDDVLRQYFIDILVTSLKQVNFPHQVYSAIPFTGDLKTYFGLSCLDGPSAYSFVCKNYVDQFLRSFYAYDLVEPSSVENHMRVRDEFFTLAPHFKKNNNSQKRFCSGILQYLQYGGVYDERFSEIFQNCNSDLLAQYQSLRDFLLITDALALGYLDSKVYTQPLLNQYKLFSLQQLLYKRLLSAENIDSLLHAYLSFLYDMLSRESMKSTDLLDQFSKDFAYWYNENVIMPYLRNENSKMSKEERTTMMTKLLALTNGNKNLGIVGLAQQVSYLKPKELQSKGAEFQVEQTYDLEALFRANLPVQFTLAGVELQEEGKLLVVRGKDMPTNVSLIAWLRFDGVKLYVERIQVTGNKELQDFVNALLKVENYVFVKMLWLIADNQAIAQQQQALNIDICHVLKTKYPQELIRCDGQEIHIKKGKNQTKDTGLLYRFVLSNGGLQALQVDDKILETQLLKAIDFTKITKDALLAMIPVILDFVPQNQDSWFWMKEQLLVNDKFVSYFKQTPKKVEIEWWVVKVFFVVNGIDFIGTYDVTTSRLAPIAIDFGKLRSPLIIQRLEFMFNDTDLDPINQFLLDPVSSISKINPNLAKRYFTDWQLNLPSATKK